ncbi:MAG: FtsX-like permease family protein [bacterium]|jgi:lipoprotein-releasing system permease protein|nr:FtsX-like permease family protein [bacterium]
MSYELFIAKKYFRSKRRTGFISLINYFSIAGVTIGVAALIIVLSVMNGFETEVRSRIIGFDAHIRFRSFHDRGIDNYAATISQLKEYEHVVALSPYTQDKSVVMSGDNRDFIFIKGVDQKTAADVSDIENSIVWGELNLDSVRAEGEKTLPGIVLGKNLALRLDVNLQDKVFLVSFANIKNFFMPEFPLIKAFRVAGLFETGLYEYDSNFGYISIESAQSLFRLGTKVSGIEIMLDQMDRELVTQVARKISDTFGYPFTAETWYERNQTLFSWMQIEKWAAFIVLSLIIMVAAFNIISTLIMVVMEKKKEIGILKSLGSTSRSIMKIFVFQGVISGLIGTITGCLIGYVLCWSQLQYRWFSLPSDIYFINALPVEMKILDFVLIGTAGILLCFFATLYPSWKAAKLDPVQAIRYE